MKKIFFILFILYAFPVSAAKILTTNPLEITDINLSKDPYIDSQYHLLLQLSLASHHHAYLDQFKVTISQAKVLDFKVSPIVNFYDKISKKYKKGLPAGKGLLKVTFQSLHPEPLKKINFQLRYQACTEKYCLLPITLTKEARVGTSTAAINKKPQSFSDIFKNPSLINHFLKNNLLLAFLIVFIAGFLTSLTPCIYPMIPITLTVLGAKTPNPLKGFLLACSYVLGIAITYSLLGLVAASTGQIFGAFMGNPVFIGFLFVVFFLMGLSLLGLFEVQVPSKVSHTLGRYKPSQSFLGAFTSGILSGVVASPCVGPILVSLLAFVSSTRNITLGLSLLFTFALGMGQIFILLGTFSQLLQKLPKSGNWMTGLKWLLGLSLFILAFYFLEPLTSHTLFYLILSASLLTLFLLYLKRPQKWPFLKKKATLLNSLLLILALFSSVYAFLPFWSTNLNTPPDFPHWQPFSEQTILNNKKPIIVDVSADWCAECKELEKTFSAPSIRDIGSQFTWLKFDATKDSPQLQKLKEKYQIRGLPFVMFFNQKGQWLQEQTLTGFESPVEFKKRLERVLQQN